MRNTLRKSEILRGYSVFSDVLKNGERAHSATLQCYFKKREQENHLPPLRIGFAVPRKNVPLAVDRNRVKRLLREVFRKNKGRLIDAVNAKNLHLNLLIVFRKAENTNIRQTAYPQIEKEWNVAVSKIISMM